MASQEATEPLAAVDLGSNSFHMIIARIVDGQLHVIDRMRERVQLAAGFDRDNNLTDEAQQRGIECLGRFGQRLRGLGRGRVKAVGTNTLRKARNSKSFLRRAQNALGQRIEIISGAEEARLIYLGVAHSLADDRGRRLVVDIGGGSTECIIGERFETIHTDSMHMGCVASSLRYFPEGTIKKERFRKAVIAARLEIEPVEHHYRSIGWDAAVGASGTINAIAQILKLNGWGDGTISYEGLRRLRKVLIAAGSVGRLSLPGLDEERGAVLPGGLAILMALFKGLGIESMRTSGGALREGLVYELLGRIRHEDVRDRTIQHLMERYAVDETQAGRVERMALWLFDQVASTWDLEDPGYRRLLGWAGRLHEVGLAIAYSGHHRHGAYLVEHTTLPGFTSQEQTFMAALIGAHRRRLKGERVHILQNVGGETAVRLAVLLRLAVRLTRARSHRRLPKPTARAKRNRLQLDFGEGWLADRPMTAADLEQEAEHLADIDIALTFE